MVSLEELIGLDDTDGPCIICTRTGITTNNMSLQTQNKDSEIAYFGEKGSFAFLAAKNRYPDKNLRPIGSIEKAFKYLEDNERGVAIVPIENSSGGFISNTVDGLLENADSLSIEEVLTMDVKLALLGKEGIEIKKIYSHFAPFHLCKNYISVHYPDAERIECDSTTAAAKCAAETDNAASLSTLAAAEIHDLDVIEYPMQQSVDNITQFFVISRGTRNKVGDKTSLVMALPNEAGALVKFLTPFSRARINLTRLISRPIPGKPYLHRFLVELEGAESDTLVAAVLKKASKVCTEFINIGAYPALERYDS